MSVSTLRWTFAATLALAVSPLTATLADSPAAGRQIHDQRQISGAASGVITAGSVAINTREFDLDKLVLSDFGDEPPAQAQ